MNFWNTIRENKEKAVAADQHESAAHSTAADSDTLAMRQVVASSDQFARSQTFGGAALKMMAEIDYAQHAK